MYDGNDIDVAMEENIDVESDKLYKEGIKKEKESLSHKAIWKNGYEIALADAMKVIDDVCERTCNSTKDKKDIPCSKGCRILEIGERIKQLGDKK